MNTVKQLRQLVTALLLVIMILSGLVAYLYGELEFSRENERDMSRAMYQLVRSQPQ